MLEEMMLEKKVWAVVGASENPDKFGSKIYRKLKYKGYKVYPVNPNYQSVDGDSCYPDLSSLPEVPEVIDMVVAPKRGKAVIEEAARLGIRNVWLQPGTYDEELMGLLAQNGMTGVKACVLVALR